jgi:chromosome segregation ATPase
MHTARLDEALVDARDRLAAQRENAERLMVQLETARRFEDKATEMERSLEAERAVLETLRAELARATALGVSEQERASSLETRLAEATHGLSAAQAELDSRIARFQAQQAELEATLEAEKSELASKFAEATARFEAHAETLLTEVTALKEQVVALDAEKQAFLEDRAERGRLETRVRDQQARLESLDAERTELLKAVEEFKASAQPEAVLEMAAEMEQLQTVVEDLQQKLAAQETELGALRRQSARAGANPVQEIYERANAELNAVKNELSRRSPPAPTTPGGSAGRLPPLSQARPGRTPMPALELLPPTVPKKPDEHE